MAVLPGSSRSGAAGKERRTNKKVKGGAERLFFFTEANEKMISWTLTGVPR